VAAGLLAVSAAPTPASAAEPFPTRAERLPSPGRNAASEDSAEAMVLNPANIGWQPAPEIRWTGVRCVDTNKAACGHSVGFATPLLFGLGTGLRADFAMPPETIGIPYNRGYSWLTWAVGWHLSHRFSIGASVQWSYSPNPLLDDMTSTSVGATYRPTSRFAFALVAHDLNGPRSLRVGPGGVPLMDRNFVGSMAFRPLGTRALEIGLEGKYYDGPEQLRPRATIGVDIPGVGRARGDVEIANLPNDRADRSYVATVGLELGLGYLSAGGGVLFGNGLGGDDFGQYGTASISLFRNPGAPRPGRAVYLRIEKVPGTRSHVKLLRTLWSLADQPDVKLVGLVLKNEPASSFAHAEEIADALRLLRSRGKKTLCHLEDNGGRSLYACASADRIVMNPSGGLRYSGLRTQHFYLARLLDNLGVKAEFVRIGAHKSAPEQFMNEAPSPTAKADQLRLLGNVEAVFVKNLATYRHLDPARIRAATARGPFVASEAREAGFVDAFAFDDELERVSGEMLGGRIAWQKYSPDTLAPERFGGRGKVGLLYVDGDIVDGRSQTIPLLGNRLVGSYTIADTIKRLRDDRDIKSVVLRIESPGGSSMASDVMWRELKLLAKKKPLIVSMGSVAASGGYYIASAADTIYALPLTVTGSIGIFYGKADLSRLLDKIGVHVETNRTTPRADAESLYRGFTGDERRELERKVGQFYDVFLDRVAKGRNLTKAQVDAVGQGAVWYGQEALDHKLVDRMGGLREALESAREAGHLPKDAPIVEVPDPDDTLLDKALRFAGVKAKAPLGVLPASLQNIARAVAPVALYDQDVAMARLEWMDLDEPAGDDDAF